jgi:hypothetical protein
MPPLSHAAADTLDSSETMFQGRNIDDHHCKKRNAKSKVLEAM